MEQAQSAIKAAFGPLFPGTTGNRGALNDSCRGGHPAPSTLVTDPMTGSKRRRGRLARVPQEDDAVSLDETTASKSPQTGSAGPVRMPFDYARATNEQLLEAARSLDKEAFTELSGRHAASVHRKVFRIVRSHEDAEDVVQEALFKAYTHLSEFRGSCTFSTWLMTIAINAAFMLLRKRRTHSEVSFDQIRADDRARGSWELPVPDLNADQTYSRRRTMDVLLLAIADLPFRYRSVLESYHAREQSLQELANTLGITVPAAKSRLMRGRLNLRASLEKKGISIADGYF